MSNDSKYVDHRLYAFNIALAEMINPHGSDIPDYIKDDNALKEGFIDQIPNGEHHFNLTLNHLKNSLSEAINIDSVWETIDPTVTQDKKINKVLSNIDAVKFIEDSEIKEDRLNQNKKRLSFLREQKEYLLSSPIYQNTCDLVNQYKLVEKLTA